MMDKLLMLLFIWHIRMIGALVVSYVINRSAYYGFLLYSSLSLAFFLVSLKSGSSFFFFPSNFFSFSLSFSFNFFLSFLLFPFFSFSHQLHTLTQGTFLMKRKECKLREEEHGGKRKKNRGKKENQESEIE